jgi:hypothetical protein
MLFAIDFHKDFIDEKGVAVSPMVSLQPTTIKRAKLDAP